MTVKRKKSLARALSSFAAYLDVPGVKLVVTTRGIMIRPVKARKANAA